jgi:hypothetical protein
MKKLVRLMLALAGLGIVCSANDSQWPVRDQESIQKVLRLTGEPMRVIVANVEGFVHVQGGPVSDVQVVAHKIIRAETDHDLEQAKRDVQLQMTESPGTVSITYDAPWVCRDDRHDCRDHTERFYSVRFDIRVTVPMNSRLVASTVNGGDLTVTRFDGPFHIRNVNGGIHMEGIGGTGDATTVNGPVQVRFTKNPAQSSSFRTVNGPVDIYFAQSLSADLSFKTLNGEVFSDFDVVPSPVIAVAERRNGKFVYRNNRGGSGRAGSGGPKLEFETVNGDIRLHRN